MNLALAFNDQRYWSPGAYIKRELAKQDDVDIVMHARIPEDTGLVEESCGLKIDLLLVVDDGNTHFKIHHHRGKLAKQTKTCIWLSDLHRPDWAAWRLQMIKEWRYDHVFYAQKNFKDIVMKQGYKETECSLLYHAVDPDIFKPMPWIAKRHDAGFVGYLNERRKKMSEIVSQYCDFKHYASVWELNACRCMNECKILWNCSVEDDVNMRTFESMATGLPLLTNKIINNGFEELFVDGRDVLTYADEDEMKEKLVRLLANPDLRKSIGENGKRNVLTSHTYRNRLNTILGTMGFPLLKDYA